LEEVSRSDLEVTPLLLNSLYDGLIIYDELGVLRRLKEGALSLYDGLIIYDELGVLRRLKEGALRLIEKARLVRYRTPDGKYGWRRVDGRPLEAVDA